MKSNKLAYINFEEVNKLLEGFNKSTGFVTAILDLEGNVLSKSGWRQICTEFHRINPETSRNCCKSDTVLANKLGKAEDYHFYKCLNGLVDVAVPIVLNGEHIANLFSGQFFFKEPDREFFKKQAQKHGFDEQKYLKALEDVPIVSKEKVKVSMDFLLNMTQLISEITLQKFEQSQAEEKIRELNERISTATRASQVGIWDWDIKNNVLVWDDRMYALYGLKRDDFAGAYEAWLNGLHPDDRKYCDEENRLALLGEKEYDTGFRVVWSDKTIHYIRAKAEVFRNETGDPVRMVGINYDITEQKKAEAIIRKKDEEFRKLSANVPDMIFQFTRKHDGTYHVPIASEGIRNIFGCTPEEVLDDFTPIGRVIYPLDAERLIRDIEYSAEHLTYFTCEFRVHIPGREIQWIYSNSTPERLPDGSVTWYGFNVDITHKKLAEEALRYQATLLSEVGIIAKVGGWEFSPITGEASWTEEVARIHDLDPTTPASVLLSINYYSDRSRPIIEKALDEAVNLGKPYDLELEIITAKENHKWIRTIGHPIFEDGKVVKLQGSIQDITERKLIQEALRESEEKFRMLLENIPLPVTYVNKAGEIIFRNDRFLQVIGYTDEEVPAFEDWWSHAYPDAQYRQWVVQKWASAVQRASEEGTDIESGESLITCKDGTERTFIVSGIIIEDNLLIIFIDITPRKKAEDEIRKLNETLEERVEERTFQLKEANQELEAFSYSVSHDLRSPLRHINGFAEILAKQYSNQLPEDARKHLNTITGSAKKMGTLIDDLLSFSRTGRAELKKSTLKMNQVIEDALIQIRPYLKYRKIDWKISQLPEIQGDYNLMRMVWINLLDNAVKYTRTREKAAIQIGYKDEERETLFFIKDNGVGFDMKYAHKLFGVFQRLHSSSQFDGTGIGLANVRRIILRHGGRTWAEAKTDKGATFYFSIPKETEDKR